MSVAVILIPLGVAAALAMIEVNSTDLCERCRGTRVEDPQLVTQTLTELGAVVVHSTEDQVLAESRWGRLMFRKVGRVFLGRVESADDSTTAEMISDFDNALGRVLQRRTAALLEERARALGFRLIESGQDDETLTYVFEEM